MPCDADSETGPNPPSSSERNAYRIREVGTRLGLCGRQLTGHDLLMATLLSVNVGRPRDVAWHGRTVHTGIWKAPVDGPVMARRLNLDGDGQGDLNGHGGEQRAVMVYQADSYEHWSEYLGRSDLTYGIFGENFTVDGLADDEVCIGDRYRIGTAEFEVTQPRTTCYRVGRAARRAADGVAARRPSPARLLPPGAARGARAGRRRDRQAQPPGPNRSPCRRPTRCSTCPMADVDTMRRLLNVAGAEPGLAGLLSRSGRSGRPSGGEPTARPAPRRGTAFGRMRVARLVRETDARHVGLPAAGRRWRRCRCPEPGQYLTVRLAGGAGSRRRCAATRCRSSPPTATGSASSARATGWPAATSASTLAAGDEIDVAAPRGEFVLGDGDEPGGAAVGRHRGDAGAGHAAGARRTRPARGRCGGSTRPTARPPCAGRRGRAS